MLNIRQVVKPNAGCWNTLLKVRICLNAVRSTAEGRQIIFLLRLHSSAFTLCYFYEGRLSFLPSFLSFFPSPGFLGLLLVFTGVRWEMWESRQLTETYRSHFNSFSLSFSWLSWFAVGVYGVWGEKCGRAGSLPKHMEDILILSLTRVYLSNCHLLKKDYFKWYW